MYQYLNAFTNRSGDALPGYFARLFDAGGNVVDLFSDDNGTPISTVSGVANAALSDSNGMFRWFVANGTYDMRFYDANDVFVSVEVGVPMMDAAGVYSDLSSDETGKGASLVVMESGDTVQEAVEAAQGSVAGKVDLDGTENVRLITDGSNPEAYGMFVQSIADGKQVDGIYGYHEIHSTPSSAGYVFHGVTASLSGVGEFSGGGIGGACGGPGGGSGIVGNRGDDGIGHGGIFTRLGSGPGNGVYGIAQGTGEGSAGRFLKQNPVAGTAGTGPAVYAINDSTNGQALYARSASANTDSNTAVIERLNGTFGTGLFTRVTGAGPRTGVLVGGSTQVTPSSSSTGASAVIGQDIQVSANISGSASVKTLNVNNSSTAGSESAGAAIVVDGANTTNYGIFVNVANGTTNYGVYVANGISYFGGNANAATQYQVGAVKVVGARKTGWATATGTATRTTFDTTTVTTAQLAERVKALIDDLYSTAGHGLLGA